MIPKIIIDIAKNAVTLMYKATDRERLLIRIISFMRDSSAFEGLLQIGSGAAGFADIYSDIDLMAGCYNADCVKAADQQLQQFFTELKACHIERRAWTNTALGLSVFLEDGLSADISFMPTPELPIRSPQHKVVFAKTDNFTETVNAGARRFAEHFPSGMVWIIPSTIALSMSCGMQRLPNFVASLSLRTWL